MPRPKTALPRRNPAAGSGTSVAAGTKSILAKDVTLKAKLMESPGANSPVTKSELVLFLAADVPQLEGSITVQVKDVVVAEKDEMSPAVANPFDSSE